ncbi:MAG TPA: hypothetical protein DCO79_08390 [Spirochaeta sp.]|nr:hypothetical protein [Spirochaeta sp.]
MKELKKLTVLVLLLFAINTAGLFAQNNNISIDVSPRVTLPMRASTELYSVGGGAMLAGIYDFTAPLYIKGGIGYELIPSLGEAGSNLISVSVGGGTRLDMGELFSYRLGLYGGGFLVVYDGTTAGNPLLGAETGLQINISDSVQASVMGSYDYYIGEILTEPAFSEQSFFEGVSVSLGVSFTPGAASSTRERRPLLEIEPPVFNPVFPVFYQYYNKNSLGSVVIRNNEKKTISDVKVSFFVNQFMEAPKLSLVIDEMESGEKVDVPLYALFKDSVLGITEGTSVTAQILVDYQEDDDFLSTSFSESINILNRNNMTWDDDRKAAAFVTANDPTVLRFARNVAASIRSEGVTAVNENLRKAMAIFQALNIYGMEYVIDPDSSYIELSDNEEFLDFLQFPQQSLDYRTGDCDDLSILYCALLESVGIRTAFITVPGHIFTAFALNMDEREAEKTFSSPENLIFIDDEAWIPIEITMVTENFLSAWDYGAKQWREGSSKMKADIYKVRDAWQTFAPTGFASSSIDINVPQTTEVLPNYSKVLDDFIGREIGPRVSELTKRIKDSNNNPRLINKLGTVYARYGKYEEAEKQFLLALEKREYLPALINLGNIAYLRDDTKGAQIYMERARAVRDDDPNVLINLARIHFDLEEYSKAKSRYREAEVIEPRIVQAYSYIVSENPDTVRASAAKDRHNVQWNEE